MQVNRGSGMIKHLTTVCYTCKSTEAVAQRYSVKKVFLKLSQNLKENTRVRVAFLTKLQASGLQLYLKKTLAHVFNYEFCKISRNTSIYKTTPVGASESRFKTFVCA